MADDISREWCEHCQQYLKKRTKRQHVKQYYNPVTKVWKRAHNSLIQSLDDSEFQFSSSDEDGEEIQKRIEKTKNDCDKQNETNMASSSKRICLDIDHPFIEEPGITDLALIVEGQKIFVNRILLAIASPVFKTMFLSDFKEKDCPELELPGKSVKDVVDFLKCIYPNMDKSLDLQTIIRILPLMHEYDCQQQVDQCKRFMVQNINPDKKDVNLAVLLQCMSLSDRYGLEESLDNCIKQGAKYSPTSLAASKYLDEVPAHVKEKLYFQRLILFEEIGEKLVQKVCNGRKIDANNADLKELGFLLDTKFKSECGGRDMSYVLVTANSRTIEMKVGR